jgi:two-component system sporulation sensor kinase C
MESSRIDKQHSGNRAFYDLSVRYRLLSDASLEGLVIHDKGKIIDTNRTFAESLGYAQSEIIGQMVTRFAAPEYRDIIMNHIFSDSEQPYDAELMRKDGTRFPVEIIGRTVDYQGKKLRVAAIRDITERKRVEQARREVEALTKGLIASSFDIAILFDMDGTILELNDAAARSLGSDRAQLLGTNGYDLMPIDVLKNRMEWIRKSVDSKRPCRFEDSRDGRWFDNCFYPILDEGDNVLFIAVVARDITDKKIAELALRESEEKWRSLVENAPDAITLVDRTGTVLYINRPPTVMDEKECVGKRYLDLAPPEYREMVRERIDHIIETGQPESFLVKYQRDTGPVWFQNRAGAVRRDDEVMAVIIISSNITEQIRTEEALREGEERYRQLVEISPEAVTAADIEGDITFVSKRSLELFGIATPDGAIGKSAFDFIAPEDHSRAAQDIQQTIMGGLLRNIEYTMVRADGSRFLGEMNATVVRDDKGNPLSFISTIRDISERKAMENQLRESEEMFRNLAEQSPNMIYISKGIRFVYVNRQVEKTLGYSKEEFYSPKFDVFRLVTPESIDLAKKNYEKHDKGEDIPPFEYTVVSRKGEKIDLILTSKLISYGGETASLGIATDITERKRAEEQILNYSERLEAEVKKRATRIQELERLRAEQEKLAATGRMAARIAHEINNPLAGIKNSFRLVKEAIPNGHQYHDYVARIDKEIDRIANIVHRVFDIYRPYQDTPRQLSVSDCIKDIVALLEASLEGDRIKIAMELPTKPVFASLPSGYLTQVLFNIIQNGIESMTEKGQVTVRLKVEGSNIAIEVADQGTGISDEIRDQIFEPFFTTKGNNASGGLGLGLSVSKGMVEAMGGSLNFKSINDQGTTFLIILPAENK